MRCYYERKYNKKVFEQFERATVLVYSCNRSIYYSGCINDGYVSPSDSGVQIEAASGFIMNAGVTAQSVKFNNSRSNDCAFIVTLYLADGTEIYKSDYLYPGDSINEIELKRTLKAGLYKDALMVYQLYSIESHKPINRCEFPIEIQTK